MCWIPLFVDKHNNVNKTCALLQTTESKDDSNIVFMRKIVTRDANPKLFPMKDNFM